MNIALLAYDGSVASGLSGFAEVLAVANMKAQQQLFTTRVLSRSGESVRAFAGPCITADGKLDETKKWNAFFLPPAFTEANAAPDPDVVEWVARTHQDGAIGCAACAGVFYLAAAGVLSGRTATTHWALADSFRIRFPELRLEPERLLVDSGDTICAGGVTAYFDLALHLVARFASSELAATVARTLLLDPGRVRQTPYMNLIAPPQHGDEAVLKAQEWLEAKHTRSLRIKDLAEAAHLGERTLLRRFKKATGQTPNAYLQSLRIEHAKRLLESSTDPVDAILSAVGYSDGPSFHRLFKSLTGLTPGAYRRRFGIVNGV